MTAEALQLLLCPYDSGHRGARMGAGPEALRAGALERLRARGRAVAVHEVTPASEWRAELRTAFELMRRIVEAAVDAHRAGAAPLLLAGNCGTTVGMVAALQAVSASARRVGLVWFDAHGDFNTPETDASGFLDGQGLAIAVGRCWPALAATVPGFAPLPEASVLHVGVRSLDDGESSASRASAVMWLEAEAAHDRAAVRAAVERLAAEVDVVHVHIDLDVHDPSIAPANGYAEPGGLSAVEVRDAVREVAARLPIASATLASYDPELDIDRRMAKTALELIETIVPLLEAPPGT